MERAVQDHQIARSSKGQGHIVQYVQQLMAIKAQGRLKNVQSFVLFL
jgi:hypothetical protein